MITRTTLLLGIIYLAFISLGLPDGVLGVAWPALRAELGLSIASMGLVTTTQLWLSALSGFLSGRVLARFGTGPVTAVSGLITAAGLLGYALSPNLLWIMVCTIPLGIGQGAVDSGLNLYVAKHYAARHMNWLHCCWGVGASAGPAIMTLAMTATLTPSTDYTGWRWGYGALATGQFCLTLILFLSLGARLWRQSGTAGQGSTEPEPQGTLDSLGSQLASAGLFFLYVGAETTTGVWLNSLLREGRDLPVTFSGLCVAVFFGAIMTGRFFSGFLVRVVSNSWLIRGGLILAGLGCGIIWISGHPAVIMMGTAALGLGFAPVYPTLMHETPRRFKNTVTRRVMGWQVGAAYVGGSFITTGTGLLMGQLSLEWLCPILLLVMGLLFLCNEWILFQAKK